MSSGAALVVALVCAAVAWVLSQTWAREESVVARVLWTAAAFFFGPLALIVLFAVGAWRRRRVRL